MRICSNIIGVGMKIGQAQLVADGRICLPRMGVQQNIGTTYTAILSEDEFILESEDGFKIIME